MLEPSPELPDDTRISQLRLQSRNGRSQHPPRDYSHKTESIHKAALLLKIADEAERGVLCTVDRKQPVPEVEIAKPLVRAASAEAVSQLTAPLELLSINILSKLAVPQPQ